MSQDISQCDSFKAAAVQCVAMDTTGQCASCIDLEAFGDAFPSDVQKLFSSAQAFAIPGTDSFCNVANDRICAEVGTKYSCCCTEPVAAWQSCLVENVFSQELSLPAPCSSSCGGSESSGGDSSGSTAIVVIVVVIVMLMGVVAWWYCRRRRRMRGDNSTAEKGQQLSPENMDDSHKEAGTLDDMEEGRLSESSDEHAARGSVPTTNIVSTDLVNDNRAEMNQEFDRPKPHKKASSRARDKKKAIEEWNKMKKSGSNRSLDSFVSKDDDSEDDRAAEKKGVVPVKNKQDYATSSKSSRENAMEDEDSTRHSDLGKPKLPKKISSRDLTKIIKENAETANKLLQMEQEMIEVEDRLYSTDREAEKLRQERDEVQRRLQELEAQNKILRREARANNPSGHGRSRSKSRDDSGERRSSRGLSRGESSERRSSRALSRGESSERRSSRDKSKERTSYSSRDKSEERRNSRSSSRRSLNER